MEKSEDSGEEKKEETSGTADITVTEESADGYVMSAAMGARPLATDGNSFTASIADPYEDEAEITMTDLKDITIDPGLEAIGKWPAWLLLGTATIAIPCYCRRRKKKHKNHIPPAKLRVTIGHIKINTRISTRLTENGVAVLRTGHVNKNNPFDVSRNVSRNA